MRKTQWLVVLLALLCMAGSVLAAEDNWRFYVGAEDSNGMYSAPDTQVGVHPDAVDGLDLYDGAPVNFSADVSQSNAWIVAEIEGENLYSRSIGRGSRDWFLASPFTLYMAAGPDYPGDTINLILRTFPDDTMLPPKWNVVYRLCLCDNKSVAGAPANGTCWEFCAPTAPNSVFFRLDNLPTVKFDYTRNGMLGNGYQFVLAQESVLLLPEPSSMLALGTSLMGIVGVAIRRRRVR